MEGLIINHNGIPGYLEIDHARGVIYFHRGDNGTSLLRIKLTQTPIPPMVVDTLGVQYDLAGVEHVSWINDQKCDTTVTPRLDPKLCQGCATSPNNMGPCATYELGMNGRCVFCDHGQTCHPFEKKDANIPGLQ